MAWLILKTALEYPGQYRHQLRRDVEFWGNQLADTLESELGDLYPNHQDHSSLSYIYAWMVDCPTCSARVPLVNSWKLAHFPDEARSTYIEPIFHAGEWHFLIKSGRPASGGTSHRAIGMCLNCGAEIANAAIINQLQAGVRRSCSQSYHIMGNESVIPPQIKLILRPLPRVKPV